MQNVQQRKIAFKDPKSKSTEEFCNSTDSRNITSKRKTLEARKANVFVSNGKKKYNKYTFPDNRFL